MPRPPGEVADLAEEEPHRLVERGFGEPGGLQVNAGRQGGGVDGVLLQHAHVMARLLQRVDARQKEVVRAGQNAGVQRSFEVLFVTAGRCSRCLRWL